MKKLHLFVLCAVFLLAACLTGVLVSCQDGQTETSSATGTGTPTEPQASASATDAELRRSLFPLPERTPRPIRHQRPIPKQKPRPKRRELN